MYNEQKNGQSFYWGLSILNGGALGCVRFLRAKAQNPPGNGKDVAECKGVNCEVESEGRWMWGKKRVAPREFCAKRSEKSKHCRKVSLSV